MNTKVLILKSTKLKLILVSFAIIIGLGLFLFAFASQSHASYGYGWVKIIANGPLGSNTCSFPRDSDAIVLIAREPYGFNWVFGNFLIRANGQQTNVTNNYYGIRDCWDPNTAVFYDAHSVPGYRVAWGGKDLRSNPSYGRGRDVYFAVYLTPNSCTSLTACPSSVNGSPGVISGAPPGSTPWFRNEPTNFTVSSRLLPGSGSSSISSYLIEILCSQSGPDGCIGFNGGTSLATSRWNGHLNGSWSANSSSLTTRTLNIGPFRDYGSGLPRPPMPSGMYTWFASFSDNTGVTSANSGGNIFGIDKIDPKTVRAWNVPQGVSCVLNGSSRDVFEDQNYRVCAQGSDAHSGAETIVIWTKVTQSPATPSFTDRYHICTNPSPTSNAVYVCSNGPLRPSPPAYDPVTLQQNYVHYRACVIDQVNHSLCTTGDSFNPKIVDPWFETRGPENEAGNPSYTDLWSAGLVGANGSFGSQSILQERDYNNPSGVGYNGVYAIIGRRSIHHHIRSQTWEIQNYDFDLRSFPAPVGSNNIYQGLVNKYSSRCRGGIPTFMGSPHLLQSTISGALNSAISGRGCNIIRYSGGGPASINTVDWSVFDYNGPAGVVFFPGDLDIKTNMRISNRTGLIFVVGGDINVCKYVVGGSACIDNTTPPHTKVTEIDGFFITNGEFKTDQFSTNVPVDEKLGIDGSVISFDSGGVDWRREGGGQGRSGHSSHNRTNPSEEIRYQPKYLWLFTEFLGEAVNVFEEQAP